MPNKSSKQNQSTLATEFDTQTWNIYKLAFSPDSKSLVLVAREHDAAVVEVGSWHLCLVPKNLYEVQRVVFSPDSSSFILASFNPEPMQCWETATAKPKWALDPGSMAASFSPDGTTVAATRGKAVLLCDAATGKILHEMPGHKSRVDHVVFSPDGKRVGTAAQSQVCLWDATNAKLIAMVREKKGEIHVIEFSPDSCSLVAANGKGKIAFYEAASGKQQHEWQAHGCHIWHLAFNAESSCLLSQSFIGGDNSTRVWEIPGFRQVYQAPDDLWMWQFTPDKKMLVFFDQKTFDFRDPATGKSIGTMQLETPSPIKDFAFSADKNWLACRLENGKVQVWRISGVPGL
jgi:WD40 repeat protein